MKIFKKLAVIAFAFAMFVPNFSASSKLNITTLKTLDETLMISQAEELYNKINDFLIQNKDVPTEEFDAFCCAFMVKNSHHMQPLNTEEFEEKSKNSVIVYRGVSKKQFADDLKSNIIYFSSNIRNVRGSGIYTTTSLDCAKHFSDINNSETVVKMLLPKTEVKILENEYLENLKAILRNTHEDEFGEFTPDKKLNNIFDSMAKYLDEQFREVTKKCEEIEDLNEQQKLIDKVFEKLELDPVYQELKATRKMFFKTNKAALFYNSGLLTKLLGFDALHTVDCLRDFVNFKEEEYLVVNPKILSVLNN